MILCIASEFVLVGLETMTHPQRREEIRQRLAESGREVIALSHPQIAAFAGNALEIKAAGGERVLAISSRAVRALTPEQIRTIEKSATLVPLDIPTIETAGGSVRCMLAGVHLDRR